MSRPIIGIPAASFPSPTSDWANPIYAQRQPYCDSTLAVGGLPVILPIIADETALRQLYEVCDGILLAGGNDIDPAQYGQAPRAAADSLSPERDAQELTLLKWALEDDKPVLGICRGMQLLNVGLGGTLYQDIATDAPGKQNHEASAEHRDPMFVAHQLRVQAGSKLAGIVGEAPLAANSQHHQAVDKIGTGLSATAWAEDAIIEALELPDKRFCIGVQLHPEGFDQLEPRWRDLFKAFVAASAAGGRD